MKPSSLVFRFCLLVSGLFIGCPFVASSLEVNEVTRSSVLGALGQMFYIPDEDLLTSQLTARGSTIFDGIPGKCIVKEPVAVDRKDEHFYSTTKSVYSAISTDTGIDLSLKGEFTMGTSLRSVTNNLASEESMVSGSSLQLYAESIDHSLSMDCINRLKLEKNFVNDFMKLDKTIKEPWLEQSWRQYSTFFKKYGSHVVKTVIDGSSIYQYAFAKTDKDYSQRNFTVKACASLAGPTEAGKLGLSSCSGVREDEVQSVTNLEMVSKLVVRGGTPETRAKVLNDFTRDNATMEKFLLEGKTDPSPILYKFIPIWDILQSRYIGNSSMAQARNLEDFYRGYLDYGCPYQETANGKVLQTFILTEHSIPEFPSYQCVLAPEGCHANVDCHYKDAFWCACGGPSCVRYRQKMQDTGISKTEAYAYNPGNSGWGWQGCQEKGFQCFCTDPRRESLVTWRDDEQRVLKSVHHNLDERRKREKTVLDGPREEL